MGGRQQLIHALGQRRRAVEVAGAFAGHPAVEAVVVCHHGVAGAQGLDQRRVGAAHLVAVHIGRAVKAQCLDHRLIVDRADEFHLAAGGRLHRLVVGVGRVVVAQHHQLVTPWFAGKTLHHFEQRVLGFGARDHRQVATRFQTQGRHRFSGSGADHLAAVGDGRDLARGHPGLQMGLDLWMVGHQVVAQPAARPFIQPEPGFGQ